MNYNGERFLLKLYQDLDKKDSVLLAESRSGKNSKDKFEKLRKYLERLERQEKVFDGEHQELEQFLKNRYYEKYVVKEEDIPESYWSHLERVELENGRGHVSYTGNKRHEKSIEIIENQKQSLDKWLNYLMNVNTAYPMWARYWAFQGMLKLGSYDKTKGMFLKRAKGTTAPFPELNPEVLAKTIDIIIKYVEKKEINDKELEKLIENGNFGKIYAYNKWKTEEAEKNLLENQTDGIDGVWILYTEGDTDKVVESLDGKGTGWCISGESTAEAYLSKGELNIYYSKDKDGNYTMPRACIRTEYGSIIEVRGIAEDQNMEPEMIDTVDKKLDEYPDKEKYRKKSLDMKRLTEIYEKQENGEKLTLDDLRFIYELDGEIEGFGWSKDVRIEELRLKNIIHDKNFAMLFVAKAKEYDAIGNYISDELKDDREVVLAAVKKYGFNLTYASEELKKDREIVLEAVKNCGYALKYVIEEFKNDREIILEAVKSYGTILEIVPEEFKKDREIVLEAVKNNGGALQYASEELKNDRELVLEMVKQDRFALENISYEFTNDKDFILEVVKNNGDALQYASYDLKGDKEVVLTAVKNDGYALRYASNDLKNDKEVVLEAVKNNGSILLKVSSEFKNDKEVVLEAVKNYGGALQYASSELKKDRELVLKAIETDGYALQYASEKLQNDKDFIIEAVKQNSSALTYVSEEFYNDKEIVLEAVKSYGSALEYVSEELKNDKGFILEVVKNNGYALRYVPDEFKNDREIVLEAVKNDGYALRYASDEFKNDKEIILEAAKNKEIELDFILEELKNDKDFILEVLKISKFIVPDTISDDLQNDPDIIDAMILQHIALFDDELQDKDLNQTMIDQFIKEFEEAVNDADVPIFYKNKYVQQTIFNYFDELKQKVNVSNNQKKV